MGKRRNIMPQVGEVRYAIQLGENDRPGETMFYCGTQSNFARDEADLVEFAREIMESPEDLGDVFERKDLVFYRVERIMIHLPDDIPLIADPFADDDDE